MKRFVAAALAAAGWTAYVASSGGPHRAVAGRGRWSLDGKGFIP